MKIRVLLFAGLADLAKSAFLDLELDPLKGGNPLRVADLRAVIELKLPQAAQTSFRVAVDHTYCQDDFLIEEGQEIALIPPVSGG